MLLSIILPTYNEAENMPILIPLLITHCSKENLIPAEIIVMDDRSPDKTAEVALRYVAKAKKENIELRIIERKGIRGLIPAVIEGMRLAKGKAILTMDSDLSHPVEAITKMVKPIIKLNIDLTIGSRRALGGGYDLNWPKHRKIISFFSGLMGKLLDWRLSDPMAGFFCCNKDFLKKSDYNKLKGEGFKILLEIIVKFKPKNVIEIPIMFKDRLHGESKMNIDVMKKYIIQLCNLYLYKIFH